MSLSVIFSFTKGILLIKKRISCIVYQKKLIPNSCGGNLFCILILYFSSSAIAVGACLFRRRRTSFDTISIPLLKLVVPPVEIYVKHDHRSGRQATEQKPVTMGKVVMDCHDCTHTHTHTYKKSCKWTYFWSLESANDLMLLSQAGNAYSRDRLNVLQTSTMPRSPPVSKYSPSLDNRMHWNCFSIVRNISIRKYFYFKIT